MPRKCKAKVGDRFGSRVIIASAPRRPGSNSPRWTVLCDCGHQSEVYNWALKRSGCGKCAAIENGKRQRKTQEQRFGDKQCGTMSKYDAGCRCEECLHARKLYLREYRKTDSGRKATKRSNLRQAFGISLEDYKALFAGQEGKCAGCNLKGVLIATDQRKSLVVDHCHETNAIRGLLCHDCNLAIGMLDNDPGRLKAAAEYLLRGASHE